MVAIVLVNTLPFKNPEESGGFILSVISLYLIPFAVFVLYTHLVLKTMRRQESKQQDKGFAPVKLGLYLIPILAFYGATHIVFFVLPQAISQGDYMRLNGISMALGLIFGGTRSVLKIREYDTHNRN